MGAISGRLPTPEDLELAGKKIPLCRDFCLLAWLRGCVGQIHRFCLLPGTGDPEFISTNLRQALHPDNAPGTLPPFRCKAQIRNGRVTPFSALIRCVTDQETHYGRRGLEPRAEPVDPQANDLPSSPSLTGRARPYSPYSEYSTGEFHPPFAPTERWAGDDSTHFPPFALYRPARSILYPPTATPSPWTAPHPEHPATRVPSRAAPDCEEPPSPSRYRAGP